jgi:hypothetical protein
MSHQLTVQLACRAVFFRVPDDTAGALLAGHLDALRPAVILTNAALQQQHMGALAGAGCHVVLLSAFSDARAASELAPPLEGDATDPGAAGSAPGRIAGAWRRVSGIKSDAEGIVCIVATSGSSDEPKYVALGAQALLHRLAWNDIELDCNEPSEATSTGHEEDAGQPYLDAHSVVAVKASVAFVDSLWELLAPLAFGAPPQ